MVGKVNAQDISRELQKILVRHTDVLAGIQAGHRAMEQAFERLREAFSTDDAALIGVIEANRHALGLLNRIMEEGIES